MVLKLKSAEVPSTCIISVGQKGALLWLHLSDSHRILIEVYSKWLLAQLINTFLIGLELKIVKY